MATRKTQSDWDRIEQEYRAGEASIREVADHHEVSEAAIRKRAAKHGWERPVTKVRKVRTQAPLLRTTPAEPQPVPEAAAIAEQGRGLVARMLDELDAVTCHQGELEKLIEGATENDRNDRRRDGMLAAISLGGRAKTLKELATAFKTINEAAAPQGKKAAAQGLADQINDRFRGVGPPKLTAVK